MKTLLCLLLSMLPLSAAPGADDHQLDLDSFEYVWKTIRDKHWDPKLGGLDWQAIHDEFRPRAEAANSRQQARAVIQAMIARLNQTHFGIIPADAYAGLGDEPMAESGLEIRVLDGHALVTSVLPGSPAAVAGVRPGWEVVRARGQELAPLLRKVKENTRSTTLLPLMLSRAVTSRLPGKTEFRDGQDRPVTLEIAPAATRGSSYRIGYLPPMSVWFESRRLEGDVVYIHFNSFLDPANLMKNFEDAVRSCAGCRGMVIDLRGNLGGLGIMAMGMAGWFVEDPELRLGTMYMRRQTIKFVINPRRPNYRGPLAILVDGLSASTAEIMAGGLQDLKRARIFGMRTAGAALPSTIERLPNGDALQYAIASYVSESGRTLEGAGVMPDEEIVPARAALLAGRDPILQAALQWINRSPK